MQRLTARKGNPAPCFFVEHPVSVYYTQKLFPAYDFTCYRQGILRADCRTVPTIITSAPVNTVYSTPENVHLLFTYLRTHPTSCTFISIEHIVRFRRDGFRIMAPSAMQRTTFHKDGCPYSRSILQTESLDVKYPYPHYPTSFSTSNTCILTISLPSQTGGSYPPVLPSAYL